MKRLQQLKVPLFACPSCGYKFNCVFNYPKGDGAGGGQRVYCPACDRGKVVMPADLEALKEDPKNRTTITDFVICECNKCGGSYVDLSSAEVVE